MNEDKLPQEWINKIKNASEDKLVRLYTDACCLKDMVMIDAIKKEYERRRAVRHE